MRSLEAGRYVCALLHLKVSGITMRTRRCVPYLLSREIRFRSDRIFNENDIVYRYMRVANQIFLSVNVHARGQRGHNRISRTRNSRL